MVPQLAAFLSYCIMLRGNQGLRLPLPQVAVKLVELFSLVHKEMKTDPAGGNK